MPLNIQTQTYASTVQSQIIRKQSMTYIAKKYLDNKYTMLNYLNENPISEDFDKVHGYAVQSNKGYNKLIALMGCGPKLIKNSYNYGLLSVVHTIDGTELMELPDLYKIFQNYKRVTKADMYYVRIYDTLAEVCAEGIKEKVTVVKMGITKEILLPENVQKQPIIKRADLVEFLRNKRVIQFSQIIRELLNVYNRSVLLWISLNCNQELVYTQANVTRTKDMEEIENWILTLLRPDEVPRTRSIMKNFLSNETKDQYCRIIGKEYVKDHYCTKCNEATSTSRHEANLEWDAIISQINQEEDYGEDDNTEEPIMQKNK